jgi:low affinity Fe/Cu permease
LHSVLSILQCNGRRTARILLRIVEPLFRRSFMPSASQHSIRPTEKPQHTQILQSVQEHFRLFAHKAALTAGSPWTFATGVALVVLWAATGRWFGYSEEWQLVVNTGTTIITFLMVFIIQNTQARDSRELHLKLDELLRAIEAARTGVIRSDDLTDEELDRLHAELRAVASQPDGQPVDNATAQRQHAAMIVRQWLKRPPKQRTAAHLAEFYRSLQAHHARLVDFPEKTDGVRELAKILRGHFSR